MYILITYDISSTKKRNKIDKILSSYGVRVNFSVFELDIKSHILEKLKVDLKKYMDKNDSIRIYILNKTSMQSAIELNEKRKLPFFKDEAYV